MDARGRPPARLSGATGAKSTQRTSHVRRLALSSKLALLAVLVNFCHKSIVSIAHPGSSFKVLNNQHKQPPGEHAQESEIQTLRDKRASDLLPQQTFMAVTQFDDDDDEHEHENADQQINAGTFYSLTPVRDNERRPAARFHWSPDKSADKRIRLVNSSTLTRERYQTQVHKTLRPERKQNKKFLGNNLFKPIVLKGDVRVRSDVVLVRDHLDGAGSEPSVKIGSLPVRTLSERVQSTSWPPEIANNNNLLEDYEDAEKPPEKLFILSDSAGGLKLSLSKENVTGEQREALQESCQELDASRLAGELTRSDSSNSLSTLAPARESQFWSHARPAGDSGNARPTGDLALKRKFGISFSKQQAGGFEVAPQQLRSAPASTSGIRVTIGNETRQLFVNSRGLITAAKRRPDGSFGKIVSNPSSKPYNPIELFASSLSSQTLSPIDKASSSSKSPTPADPSTASGLEHGTTSNLRDVPSSLMIRPGSDGMSLELITGEHQANSKFHTTLGNDHVGAHHQSSTTSSFGPSNKTTTMSSMLTTTMSNFQHNPPYKQRVSEQAPATTPSFAFSSTRPSTTRPNDRFDPTRSPGQRKHPAPVRVVNSPSQHANRSQVTTSGHRRPTPSNANSQAPPYAPPNSTDLLSEPANSLPIHQRPLSTQQSNNSNLAHLQQSIATVSLKPTKIRNKLLQSLFKGQLKPPQKTADHAHHARPAQGQNSPAPLLSSTVANNVALLLAQKLSSLVQPPHAALKPPRGPLNSLFGFRVGQSAISGTSSPSATESFNPHANKLKHRVNPFASQVSPSSLGHHRRTTGVGSLLVSGLVYGLTVLPALMALTGINPLSSVADSMASGSSPGASSVPVNRQQSAERKPKSGSKSKQRPSGTTEDPLVGLLLGDSAAASGSKSFAYLLPLISPGGTPGVGQAVGNQHHLVNLQPSRHGYQTQNEAQSSALKSLYAPPPTVLEPFGGSDLSNFLDEQPVELDWPPAIQAQSYLPPDGRPQKGSTDDQISYHGDSPSHRPFSSRAPNQQNLRYGSASWNPGSSEHESGYLRDSPAGRHNRDLSTRGGGNNWRATSDGGAPTTTTTPAPTTSPTVFDDRSSVSGSVQQTRVAMTSASPQDAFEDPSMASLNGRRSQESASRHHGLATSGPALIQIAPPPMYRGQRGEVQPLQGAGPQGSGWSVGTEAGRASAFQEQHTNRLAAMEDRAHDLPYRLQQASRADVPARSLHRQLSFVIAAQNHQLRQQQQLAHLGDDLAILSPYKPMLDEPVASSLSSLPAALPALDSGGLRRRRTVDAARLSAGNVTRDVWSGSQAASELAVRQHDGHSRHLEPPNNLMSARQRSHALASESAWRAIEPVGPPLSLAAGGSRARQDDKVAPSNFYGGKKRGKIKGKAAKRKRLQELRRPGGSTTTKVPKLLAKDDGESELLLAHSMAMGSRVLNEQLVDRRQ